MTKEAYTKHHDMEHEGKHEKKWYHVWVVRGPAGPVEEMDIFGLDEAKSEVRGGWDYEVIRINDGKVMRV